MYYELYKDRAGYWRWTLFAVNHRKIADSGEGYVNKNDAVHGIGLVKGSTHAPVYERERA